MWYDSYRAAAASFQEGCFYGLRQESDVVDCYIEVDTSSGNMAKRQLPSKKSTEMLGFPTRAKKQQFP